MFDVLLENNEGELLLEKQMKCLEFILKYSKNICIKTRVGTIGIPRHARYICILKPNFHNCTYTFLRNEFRIMPNILIFYLTSSSAFFFWVVRNLGGDLTYMTSWLCF